jgi:mRNA-degrading endonuclease RelE of RelBE toxin-antitoxin system
MTRLGKILFKIEYLPNVVSKDIPDLPKKVGVMIMKAINKKLMIDPVSFGKPLRHNLKGLRRLRVSNYRIVYYIKGQVVMVTNIKHRKDIYED